MLLVLAGLWIVQATIPRALSDYSAGQAFRHDPSCDRTRLASRVNGPGPNGLCEMEELIFTERYVRDGGRSPNSWVLLARDTTGSTRTIRLSSTKQSWQLGGSLKPGDRIRLLRYHGVAAPAEVVAVAAGHTVVRAGEAPDVLFWFDLTLTIVGVVTIYGGAHWLRTGQWHPPLPDELTHLPSALRKVTTQRRR